MTIVFTIQDLRDAPQHAEAIAKASAAEWSKMTDLDISDMRGLFNPAEPRGSLPVTLVASYKGKFGGFVSLRSISMGAVKHPESYLKEVGPWLSNMWVEEWARGQGLASFLTSELTKIAQSFGYKRIYSSTAESNSLYHKLGYRTLETRDMGSFIMYLIAKDI